MNAITYAMSDIYGGFAGTTETTVPEDYDKKALVDEQSQTAEVTESAKATPIYLGIVLIIILAIIMGVLK